MKCLLSILCLLLTGQCYPQTIGEGSRLDEQLELQAERQEGDLDDDFHLQQREEYRKQPLDLNKATESELKELFLLNALQIRQFIQYRQWLGNLISLYELQAIPGWDIALIQKLLPYIKAGQGVALSGQGGSRWWQGEHSLLLRTALVLEKAKGFHPSTDKSHFMGNRPGAYVRYTYSIKNALQVGLKGDKDPGEPFLNGKHRGFDFYSFYIFLRNRGIIKSLALGDFTVNMGQGLMQWQTLAFKKSADLSNLKRQSPVLLPHSSSGEINFHRGIGLTVQKGRWEATAFASMRKISGNMVYDSVDQQAYISSLNVSGYHRTPSEIADRNNVSQLTFGGTVKYATKNWHLSANGIRYLFSSPFRRQDDPYNSFDAQGRDFANAGLDFSFTHKNLHFFGEAALDRQGNRAFLNGLLAALDPKVDVSLVQRSIDRGYHSLYSNALTESAAPVNEKGLYTGLSIRPFSFLSIDAYKDAFRFPWLKYRVDAPSGGNEYFIRISYIPNKQAGLYCRYIYEKKQSRLEDAGMGATGTVLRRKFRVQSNFAAGKSLSLTNRCEMSWYKPENAREEQGFLFFQDMVYKSPSKPFTLRARLAIFETDGYDTRLYAFESAGGTGFSIPAYFDKGYQYYANFHYDLSRLFRSLHMRDLALGCWIHFSRTVYPEKSVVGSGPNEIRGTGKTELRVQMVLSFN